MPNSVLHPAISLDQNLLPSSVPKVMKFPNMKYKGSRRRD